VFRTGSDAAATPACLRCPRKARTARGQLGELERALKQAKQKTDCLTACEKG
jgi:hypothetical protein